MTTNRIVLVAESNSIVRLGLRQLLTRYVFSQIHETSDSDGLMNQLGKYDYSHLVIDFNLCKGYPYLFLQTIKEKYPQIVILLYTSSYKINYQRLVDDHLIQFYMDKECAFEESKNKLKLFSETDLQTNPAFEPERIQNPYVRLSERQNEVLEYLIEGYSTREISQRMNVKDNTVSTMKSILFNKLNVSSLVDLIHLTKQHQLF